ncbi:MAG: hypothetical protein WD042_11370 [Phycisphaeraceae bacterium]
MKLILSRKGFDTGKHAGGCPSPILPDGRMVSLPIPLPSAVISYGEIERDGQSIGPMVEQLTGGRIPQKHLAHLDPDLVEQSLPRRAGWRPIFGQVNQAQSHLRNCKVGPGDLFLFFGLFRRTRMFEGQLTWVRGEHPRHVIWGWLQVDEVLSPSDVDRMRYDWALDHPHFHLDMPSNTIYIARQRLGLGDGFNIDVPGGGAFPRYLAELQLTAEDASNVTDWQLPTWFFPHRGRTPLTYHAKRDRWERCDGHTRLSAAARGQEFVLDCGEYPEAIKWLAQLLSVVQDQ